MTYLADTSAVWRFLRNQVDDVWNHRADVGLIAICPPVESELNMAVRSEREYSKFFDAVEGLFTWVPALDDPWPKVHSVQRELMRVGHHRRPSPMDILIALSAHRSGLTLLHVDDDFTSISKVRPDIAMMRLEENDR
jgi:predicted nucleic acid-binding protein